MKYPIHNITLKVFIKEGEDFEKIKEKFVSLIPFDLEEAKIAINVEDVEGLTGDIKILKVKLEKARFVNAFMEEMLNRLTKEQKELLINQKESRLDENLNFFIRFDKQKIMENDELDIVDHGDCFHLRILIAAFPAKVEKGLPLIEEIFS